MHEFSLASSMLETVAGAVAEPSRVTVVNVTVGPLSGVCAESLEFCFGAVAEEQGFTAAKLHVTRAPARLRCGGCGGEYAVERLDDFCPSCGSLERTVLSGAEFTLDSVEVED